MEITIKYLTEEEAYYFYNEMLDKSGEKLLKELDPTAYNCGFNHFVDSLQQDGYTVERY